MIPAVPIKNRIFTIRNHKVMIDRDLAILYKISTKVLNQAVRRNLSRFPEDFMFQLTKNERDELVTNCDRFETLKHSTTLPYAFTEQGVSMLSSVLNSEIAIVVNIQIIRTFVNLRRMITARQELWLKVDEMEKKYDKQFQVVFRAIKLLLDKSRGPSDKRWES